MLSSLKKKLSSVQERTAARAALHGNIERENAAKEAAAAARKPFDNPTIRSNTRKHWREPRKKGFKRLTPLKQNSLSPGRPEN
jgi:hypothetical protein